MSQEFRGIDAYAAGVLCQSFGVSPWLCIPAGAFVALVASAVICLPVLRVKGIYVCLVTFAFGQLCLHATVSLSEHKLEPGRVAAVVINHAPDAAACPLRLQAGWRVAQAWIGAMPNAGVLALPGNDAAVLELEQA